MLLLLRGRGYIGPEVKNDLDFIYFGAMAITTASFIYQIAFA